MASRVSAFVLAILAAALCADLALAKKTDEPSGSSSKQVLKEQLTSAEIQHLKNQRFFFSIGEGFEGSASDWTEYFVWLLGVIGVFYYMSVPNARRNPYEDDDDEQTEDEQQQERYRDGGSADNGIFEHSPVSSPSGAPAEASPPSSNKKLD